MEKVIFVLALAVCYAGAVPLDEDKGSTRIIDGVAAAQNQFSYAASLQLASASAQPYRGHRCGGVLFTYQHTLTAASCLYDNVAGVEQVINAMLYQVFAGDISITNASPDRIRPVANFTIHPEFMMSSRFNDIAIITLTAPFQVGGQMVPIALPPVQHDLIDFTLCTVAGWGGTNITSTASQQLMYAQKYTYNQNLCTLLFNMNLHMLNIMPTMLCAATFNSLSSACAGDIGNGLVCNNTLTGILFHSQNCGPSTFPELYTRVNNYTTWIRTISGSYTFTPASFMLVLFTVLTFITA